MNLKPSEIFFSQDSINNKFDKRSQHRNQHIGVTLDDLCEGRCVISDIPKISVMKNGGKWIAADNRRLWVFRQMERHGKCDTIQVLIVNSIPDKKKTSTNGGISVTVRNSAGGSWCYKPDAPRLSSSSTGSNNTFFGNHNDQNTLQIKSMTAISYNAPTKELDNSRASEDNDRPTASSTISTCRPPNLTATKQPSYASNDTVNSIPQNSQLGDSIDNTGLQSGDIDCPAKNKRSRTQRLHSTEKSAKKRKGYKAKKHLKRSLTSREEDSLVLWLQSNPFLYDKASSEFKFKEKKRNSWTEKEKELNLNPGDLSARWYPNMRSQFLKIIRFYKHGSGASRCTARRGWLQRRFDFLRPFLVGLRCPTERRSNRQKTPKK
ncbi:hypothetical protein ACF0H5_000469 [Mactra antiquata]